MNVRVLSLALIVSAVACFGCAGKTSAPAPAVLGAAEAIAFPAADSSLAPQLAVDPAGGVHAVWFEKRPAGRRALKLSRLTDGAWSEPRVVAESDSFFVNWADVPALLARDAGHLAIAYAWKSGGDPYAYDVRIVQSSDGGATWSAPVTPHRDGTPTEHGFVSLAEENGAVRAVWLDGRKMAEKPAGGHGHEEHGADMTLRTAVVGGDGALSDEAVLDERTCDCCPTSMIATSGGGMALAYRDRDAEEIRDFSVILRSNGSWSAPKPLAMDGWKIQGCPVNGAALAAEGDRVVAAWFTEAGDRAAVRFARSSDGGATFSEPLAVADTTSLGRVDVLLHENGSALVSYMNSVESTGRVTVRSVAPDGTLGAPVEIAQTSARRSSGMPRMALSGSQVVFLWTEDTDGHPTHVRSAIAEWK